MTVTYQPAIPGLQSESVHWPAGDRCQRWRERQHSWRRVSEGGFDQRRYDVAPIADALAKGFVVRHHYSGTHPAARFSYGLFERGALVGAAVLSVPVQRRVLTGALPWLEPYAESLELGRFVLLDSVAANGESWFLARVFEQARATGLRGVVSFSDPVPRTTLDGRVVCRGHVGVVYQASNARYTGRGAPGVVCVLPDGTALPRRALSKLRAGDTGRAYAERRLRRFGAPPLEPGQNVDAWLAAALRAARARLVRHPGCHRYVFVLDRRERRHYVVAVPDLPYPKRKDTQEVLP